MIDVNTTIKAAHNIVLVMVGQTVVNSIFVILLGICANVGLMLLKCPTIANTFTVDCKLMKELADCTIF